MAGQDAAYHRIKKKYAEMEQDPLPLSVPAATAPAPLESKQRGPRSIRQADCPYCLTDGLTGVVLSPSGVEVFRQHNKVMHKGRRVPCAGSGKEAPQ